MAKATRLLELAKGLKRQERRDWFDALPSDRKEQISEVIEAIRDGRVKASHSGVARLIIEQCGLALSAGTVRSWLSDRVREVSDG